jgi:hypothetical protein
MVFTKIYGLWGMVYGNMVYSNDKEITRARRKHHPGKDTKQENTEKNFAMIKEKK